MGQIAALAVPGTRSADLSAAESRARLLARLEAVHGEAWAWALTCAGRRREAAEDALQEACLRVLDGRARYGGLSSFRTWFFGVVRRTAQEQLRARFWLLRRDLESRDLPACDGTQGRLESEQEQRRLQAAMQRLPARQRETLSLVFGHGLTVEDAAEVLGVSRGSAAQHLARGKERLKKWLLETMR